MTWRKRKSGLTYEKRAHLQLFRQKIGHLAPASLTIFFLWKGSSSSHVWSRHFSSSSIVFTANGVSVFVYLKELNVTLHMYCTYYRFMPIFLYIYWFLLGKEHFYGYGISYLVQNPLVLLKGVWHEIWFGLKFFSWISFSRAPEYPIGTVSSFSKIRGDIREWMLSAVSATAAINEYTFSCFVNIL
jgi:hypothetical protein